MRNRIEYIIKAESLTNLQFAQSLDITPAAITHILSGRNNPSVDIIVRIARKYPHYNLRWLLLGEGKIYNSADGQATPRSQESDLFSGNATVSSKSENSTNAASSNNTIHTSDTIDQAAGAEEQKLIVCMPDGTYREYVKQK